MRAGDGEPALPLGAFRQEPRAWRLDGLLGQRRRGVERIRSAQRGRHGQPGARVRRHRRPARGARDAVRGGARDHLRGRQPAGRGHRFGWFQRGHGRQPHDLRQRLGGLRGGDGHPPPARGARRPDLGDREWPGRLRRQWHDRGPASDEGKERTFSFKEICGHLPMTGGLIQGRADVAPRDRRSGLRLPHRRRRGRHRDGQGGRLRYTAVQDVGTAIHPAYVEGRSRAGRPRVSAWR